MKSVLVILLAALLMLPLPAAAHSHETECTYIQLVGASARATPEGAPHGAVFGTLVNLTASDDTLTGASSDVAEFVEIHEMTVSDDGVMRMNPLADGLEIPAGQYRSLESGGLHIMLINLVAPLEAGSSFTLTLHFAQAGDVPVTVNVLGMDGADAAHGAMDMHGHAAGGHDMTHTEDEPVAVDAACAGIHILGAWVRPANEAMPTSAAYALLLNLGDTEETLLGAATDVAQAVELHEMIMAEGDVMRMQAVEGGIAIPAGEIVALQPGGLHVMLIGLTGALTEGETLPLTLTFAHAGDIPVTAHIRQPDTPMAAMSHH